MEIPTSDVSRSNSRETMLRQAESLTANEPDWVCNAANLSALIYWSLEKISWAGFYVFDGKELVLGPFQGKPACTRIALGKGVCGTAAQQRRTVVVDNVNEFEGHIACDAASQSEVVVPLVANGKLFGVLDVDSADLARFDAETTQLCEGIAAIFVRALK
jgi:L-methionine (R)-S-oxide reductase